MENLIQMIRVLQHRDTELQLTINSISEKLLDSERKRAENDEKFAKTTEFSKELKKQKTNLEKVQFIM